GAYWTAASRGREDVRVCVSAATGVGTAARLPEGTPGTVRTALGLGVFALTFWSLTPGEELDSPFRRSAEPNDTISVPVAQAERGSPLYYGSVSPTAQRPLTPLRRITEAMPVPHPNPVACVPAGAIVRPAPIGAARRAVNSDRLLAQNHM